MIIPDINLLVYAYDEASPFHRKAKSWLSKLLAGGEEVGLPLVSLLGFIRLVSNAKVFETPMSPESACNIALSWLATPSAALLEAGPKHFDILHKLLAQAHITSALTTDAHIAALAIEHKAIVHSNDNDFNRFPDVRWSNPLED